MSQMSRKRSKAAATSAIRMGDRDVDKVLNELDQWLRGERSGVLTWKVLEDFAGFSRQTLSKKSRIVQLYDKAKATQRNTERTPPKSPDERFARLSAEVEHLRRVIDRYDERFARVAYWCNAKGISLSDLIEPMPARHRDTERQRSKERGLNR
ncbi:MAG TPA: hypothetical protein VMB26_01590 [Candidatus Binataceae bacterium]|nr:hypothetical protein [Candidatus Binataceae bacterium]